ncbi:MAG: PaaI family thioesterase [Dehalococcoidales bacterium]|nr:PaaI family thioesterase [Dehalococcoidales bacterium]MDP7286077.1 PaaI family thioesterase [Dehalococcoidales bacterium]MDP7416115.1 PaaI family thioesterase [Dehalococcoidales bacterium]
MVNRRVPMEFDISGGLRFGCGQNNPLGLKLNFRRDGGTVRAEFTPARFYQGWLKILHGGVIASLLDEAMGWAVRFYELNDITARMEVYFRRPISVDGFLVVTGTAVRSNGKFVETEAKVSLPGGTLMAEGIATYVAVVRPDRRQKGKS